MNVLPNIEILCPIYNNWAQAYEDVHVMYYKLPFVVSNETYIEILYSHVEISKATRIESLPIHIRRLKKTRIIFVFTI